MGYRIRSSVLSHKRMPGWYLLFRVAEVVRLGAMSLFHIERWALLLNVFQSPHPEADQASIENLPLCVTTGPLDSAPIVLTLQEYSGCLYTES
jgi:hypothetical protein